MAGDNKKTVARDKKRGRVRVKIAKNRSRHRLTVFRSNRNIYAQIVDDAGGVTVVQASTMDKEFRRKSGEAFTKDTAREIGKRLASRAKEKNIVQVVFDRGPYLYHGKVKALADGAREGGLDF
ncbi:MAG: 50S ribosomal protein L18 [Pseudomonadota bacterium]